MVRKIMRNPMFLAQKCEPATEKDAQIDHCNGIVV